jgi:hypothetical protein
MIRNNYPLFKVKYLPLILGLMLVGCGGNSSGSLDSVQIDEDEDPTHVEVPRVQNPPQIDDDDSRENLNSGFYEGLDEKGEVILLREFDQAQWGQMMQEYNLSGTEEFTTYGVNSQYAGADQWKSWNDYEYRIIYFSSDGALRAKPVLRRKDGTKIQMSNQTIDSLNMDGLWEEIQNKMINISNTYQGK